MNLLFWMIPLLAILQECSQVTLTHGKTYSPRINRRLSEDYPGFNEQSTVNDYLSNLEKSIGTVRNLKESLRSLVNSAKTEEARVFAKLQAMLDTNSLDISLNNLILKEVSQFII